MNLFDTPWIVGLLIIALLFMLAIREFVLARQIPPQLPERGIGFFHSAILLGFALASSYGMHMLYSHAKVLTGIIPLYPVARYAPEREAFEDKGVWVFASPDGSEKIAEYYKETAKRLGYKFSSDNDAKLERIYLSRGDMHMFLTISDEGSSRILYYSEAGEVRTVSVPTSKP